MLSGSNKSHCFGMSTTTSATSNIQVDLIKATATDNMVRARFRFSSKKEENSSDEKNKDAQHDEKPQKTRSSEENERIELEEDRWSPERRRQSRSGRHRSKNFLPSRGSVSSDGSSSMSSDLEAAVAAAALAVAIDSNGNSPMNALTESPWTYGTKRSPLHGIGEQPSRSRRYDEEEDKTNTMALVPSTWWPRGRQARFGSGKDSMAMVPIEVPKSTGSSPGNTDRQLIPSKSYSDNKKKKMDQNSTDEGSRGGLSWKPTPKRKDNVLPISTKMAFEKVKRHKIEAKAAAWQEAKAAKIDNRYSREKAIILGWENEKKLKANNRMQKVERKLEKKRAKALERMRNEIARVHKKAEDRRAIAEAIRVSENAKLAKEVAVWNDIS
eukprot:Gb_27227 [translate_table: standard]